MNKLLSLVAMAVLTTALLLALVFFPRQETSQALVSIDINPSIDIKLDSDNMVTEIIPLNDDAYQIYDESMIGQEITTVMQKIITNAQIEGFLNDSNNNVIVSSSMIEEQPALDDDELSELGTILTTSLQEYFDNLGDIRILYLDSDSETAQESEDSSISLGRLELAKVTGDQSATTENMTDFVTDPDIDVALGDNVIVEDDSCVDSLKVFVDKLRTVPVEEVEGLEEFLAGFDEDNQPLADNPDYLALMKEAKSLWKPVMHEYNVIWAHSNGSDDDEATTSNEETAVDQTSAEDDEDLQDSLDEFVAKLDLIQAGIDLDDENYGKLNQWLETYHAGLNEGTLLQQKNQARDLVNEYKKLYPELLKAANDDEDEDEAELAELQESIDSNVAKLQAMLDEMDSESEGYQVIANWLETYANRTDESLSAIKSEAQELVKEYRTSGQKTTQSESNDQDDEDETEQDEDDSSEAKANQSSNIKSNNKKVENDD